MKINNWLKKLLKKEESIYYPLYYYIEHLENSPGRLIIYDRITSNDPTKIKQFLSRQTFVKDIELFKYQY